MNIKLDGKLAVVTGGSAGIGKEICNLFAAAGAEVVVIGASDAGKKVLEELQSISDKNHAFLKLDISNFSAVQEAFGQLIQERGKLDILVNNAGIAKDNLLLKMKEEDWDAVVDTNLKGCFNTCKAVVRQMMKQKGGAIVNIASVVALTGNPGQVNYAASKGGMVSLSKSLAKEMGSRGIRVNVICPGFTATRMTENLPEAQKEILNKEIPLGRMGAPEEIAKTALFLASDLASYITGETLRVDGGLAM